MKTKDIEFNADDLVGSAEAFAHHLTGKQKLTLRTATMPLPPRVKPLTPSRVRSIREKLNVSQPVFAAMMNIPTCWSPADAGCLRSDDTAASANERSKEFKPGPFSSFPDAEDDGSV